MTRKHMNQIEFERRIGKPIVQTLVCLACVCVFPGSGCAFALQDEASRASKDGPPLLQQLKNRSDELRFEKLLETSTVEAEILRRSLLKDAQRPAMTLGAACVRFRGSQELTRLFDGSSYDLSRFELTDEGIALAIQGKRPVPNPAELYGSFQGKWFGLWDKNKVDHHWGEYVRVKPPATFELPNEQPVILTGYQYAWIGDGYGINHVCQTSDKKQTYLLGYVVHVRDEDPEKELLRRPHVGVIDGPGRLIWMTKSEVFFEEMVKGETPAADRYFITGFRYSIKNKVLNASEAFHAVYSRNAENRRPWRGFKIEMTVTPPSARQ